MLKDEKLKICERIKNFKHPRTSNNTVYEFKLYKVKVNQLIFVIGCVLV